MTKSEQSKRSSFSNFAGRLSKRLNFKRAWTRTRRFRQRRLSRSLRQAHLAGRAEVLSEIRNAHREAEGWWRGLPQIPDLPTDTEGTRREAAAVLATLDTDGWKHHIVPIILHRLQICESAVWEEGADGARWVEARRFAIDLLSMRRHYSTVLRGPSYEELKIRYGGRR